MQGDALHEGSLRQWLRKTRGIVFVDRTFRLHSCTYADLARGVAAAKRFFRGRGVRPGDRVLLSMGTEPAMVRAFLGLLHLGAIPFSVAPPLMGQDAGAYEARLVRLARAYRVGAVLETGPLRGLASKIGTATVALPRPPQETDAPPVPSLLEPLSRRGDEVAFVQFSSGSTSDPKGVPITFANLLDNLQLIVQNDRRRADSVMVSWLPLYHDMGLVGGLFSNFVRGNAAVLLDPLGFIARPVSWLRALSRAGGTLSPIPNFALDLCTDRIPDPQLEEERLDLSTVEYVYNGSEPVRLRSIERFEQRFGPFGLRRGCIYPVYGMSEATLIVTAPAYGEPVVTREIEGRRFPAVGFPLGDFDVRICDEQGRALQAGRVGELWLRGSSVTPGYWDPAGRFSGRTPEGWLPSGDLGTRDEAGRVYITGRKKDLILHRGRNFYGHDIAGEIEVLPWVRKGKTYVFSVDLEGEERVVVLLGYPREAGRDSAGGRPLADYAEEIRAFVFRRFGLPVHDVRFVSRLPKTTSGKVARHLCERLYLDMVGANGEPRQD